MPDFSSFGFLDPLKASGDVKFPSDKDIVNSAKMFCPQTSAWLAASAGY